MSIKVQKCIFNGLAGLSMLLLMSCSSGLGAAEVSPTLKRAATARKALDQMLGFLSKKPYAEKLQKLSDEHEQLAQKAHEWLYDNKNYPFPAKARTGWSPGKDTQPGHEEMERRVSASVAKYNELMMALSVASRIPHEVLGGPITAKPLVANISKVHRYGLVSLQKGLPLFLSAFKTKHAKYLEAKDAMKKSSAADTEQTKESPLIAALGALANDEVENARQASTNLSGLEAQFFWYLRAFYVVGWNQANPLGHSEEELSGTRLLNVYRISLKLNPLAHNKKIHAMAKDFAQEMEKHKFFGHTHPSDPTRKTMGDRAKRVDYRGISGENCSGGGRGESAIWRWRSDAAHHRGMIQKSANEIGLGSTSKSVLNVGRSGESQVVKLFASSGRRKRGRK